MQASVDKEFLHEFYIRLWHNFSHVELYFTSVPTTVPADIDLLCPSKYFSLVCLGRLDLYIGSFAIVHVLLSRSSDSSNFLLLLLKRMHVKSYIFLRRKLSEIPQSTLSLYQNTMWWKIFDFGNCIFCSNGIFQNPTKCPWKQQTVT